MEGPGASFAFGSRFVLSSLLHERNSLFTSVLLPASSSTK
jgi:hypothetical protein